MPLQHLRSSTANKRPTPASMSDGQLAINTNLASPGLFFKDSNGALVKVGPVHVGTTAPNASPAVGGQAGNSVGEQWLDTSSSRYVFKVWDGTAWRSESGEFVDASGDVMTGALGIIAGTVGAPGLYFSGDTNTGIYSPAADTIAFVEGGVEGMRIDSSGNVGIGTSAPWATQAIRFDTTGNGIAGDVTTARQFSVGASSAYQVALGYYQTGAAQAFAGVIQALDNSAATRLLLNPSGGNVGIGLGTTSPARLLHLSDTTGQPAIKLSNNTSGHLSGDGADITFTGTNLFVTNREAGAIIAEANGSERARIDSTGRLLVGATAMPAGNFGGFGNNYIQVFNSSSIASYAALSTINDYFGSNLFLGKARSTSAGIVQNNDIVGQIVFAAADGVDHASAAGAISCRIDGTPGADNTPGRLVFSTTADGASSPTERLRIDSSGRVGIGTSSPSQLLHVNGNSLFGGSPAAQYSVVTVASDLAIQAAAPLFNFVNAAGSTRFAYINHTGTSGDFFILNQEAGSLRLGTNNAERARIDSSGNVGIGTSSPGGRLQSSSTAAQVAFMAASATADPQYPSFGFAGQVGSNGNRGAGMYLPADSTLAFSTTGTERLRIDSSGRLLVGTSASVTTPIGQPPLQVTTGQSIIRYSSNGTFPASIDLCKSKTDTVGTNTILGGGDQIGWLTFAAADGSSYVQAARIAAEVDGTPGANDMPGRLVFSTTADGASSPTERFRIDSSGNASFAGTGALKLHAGTTAERPGTPTTGMVRYNSSITQFEGYNGSAWGTIGGGAKGAGSDQVFFENDQTVTTSYTITAGKNAMSAGPVTIGSGVTVTVPSGSVWVVV